MAVEYIWLRDNASYFSIVQRYLSYVETIIVSKIHPCLEVNPVSNTSALDTRISLEVHTQYLQSG